MTFAQRWKVNLDAAWLPYVKLYGKDTHWLRIGNAVNDFTGPIPEDGRGWGYQLEGAVSYLINPTASIGVGVRYWQYMQVDGNSHFEGLVVGATTGAAAGWAGRTTSSACSYRAASSSGLTRPLPAMSATI